MKEGNGEAEDAERVWKRRRTVGSGEGKETECRGTEASGREGACGLELREIRVPVFWKRKWKWSACVWNTAERVLRIVNVCAGCRVERGPAALDVFCGNNALREVPETTDVDGT